MAFHAPAGLHDRQGHSISHRAAAGLQHIRLAKSGLPSRMPSTASPNVNRQAWIIPGYVGIRGDGNTPLDEQARWSPSSKEPKAFRQAGAE